MNMKQQTDVLFERELSKATQKLKWLLEYNSPFSLAPFMLDTVQRPKKGLREKGGEKNVFCPTFFVTYYFICVRNCPGKGRRYREGPVPQLLGNRFLRRFRSRPT